MADLFIKKVLTPPTPGEIDTLSFTRDSRGKLVTHMSDNQGLEVASGYDSDEIRNLIDERVTESPILSGPASLNLNQVGSYRILNYNFSETYLLEAINGGVVTRIDDVITYKAPSIGKVGGFIINTSPKYIDLINPSEVLPPTITSPTMGDQGIFDETTIEATAFEAVGESDVHVASTWQMSLTETFDELYMFSNDNSEDLTEWTVSGLPNDTIFFVRVKYEGSALGYGDWSPIIQFRTLSVLIDKPSITSPTDGAVGVDSTINVTSSPFNVLAGEGTHDSSDWEVATDDEFTNVVQNSLSDTINKTSYDVTSLLIDTTYYVRVRYQADNGIYSDWSESSSFTTKTTFETEPSKPSIVFPTNGASDVSESVTASSSAFAVDSGTDTQVSATWELASDIDFTNIIDSSINSTTNKTTWLISNLSVSSTYYVRVKHTGSITGDSQWSDVVTFSTLSTFVDKPNMPIITNPANAETDVTIFPTITTNAFAVASGTDVHESSTWELSTDNTFTVVDIESVNDVSNLVSWEPTGLSLNTTYYARVKHTGVSSGESDWSGVVSFTTREFAIDAPDISSPTEASTNNYEEVNVTSNAFNSVYEDTHATSEWEVSFSNDFVTPDISSGDSSDLTSYLIDSLDVNTDVYVRVRYKDTQGRVSSWSTVRHFKTDVSFIDAPDIVDPANGATNIGPNPNVTSNAFNSKSGNLTHDSSDWQLSTVNDFSTTVEESLSDVTNKTSITFNTNLEENTTYYVRVRYNSGTYVSDWSTGRIFSTNVSWINKPSILSPVNGATNIGANVTITSSDYDTLVPTLLHVSSDWELSTDSGFATTVYSSLEDTVNKTSWTAGPLLENTTYYVRVRYNGSDE